MAKSGPETPKVKARPRVTVSQPLGLYAGDLLERTKEYFEAFNHLGSESEKAHLFARYFLFSHALDVELQQVVLDQGEATDRRF
ncbi:hypothetical protein, partial [Mesorhizobium sp.]|uniref:hypothetical protein n=1 Tax=Mesorhizobium sp. TaxID=1871066 RepID=UPI0025CE8520